MTAQSKSSPKKPHCKFCGSAKGEVLIDGKLYYHVHCDPNKNVNVNIPDGLGPTLASGCYRKKPIRYD